MNVYDFDKTILNGDSEDYFFEYVLEKVNLSKKAKRIFKFNKFLIYLFKRYYYVFRKRQYYFLREIDDVESLLESFWDEHIKDIKKWYLNQKRDDDVISSATPRFILTPLIARLDIKNLIATEMDKNGVVKGKFNYRKEKVKTFKKIYKDIIPDSFYSDSNTDKFLAKYSKIAYKVDGDKITLWYKNK